ncbi:MAG: hypothetical protein A2498_10945 [Lentisphaerae bacterium RIFOXYC12_FULL_60_16]|nr:MAG: hypothetical protein A2498_10945 [Lentisphaerae bacterium RIFOXYC12_FULL_60_16]
MAFPMLAGTFAMNAYNLTDTWFVSRLGTLPLAAMGFTFPVVMLLTCVAGGLGTGITTLVSHAIGRHAHEEAKRIVTHGFALTMAVSLLISIAGYFSIDGVFIRLGADAEVLPLVGDYMRIWYFGAVTMAMPMIGNGILISTGDSKSASLLMILGMALNVILDPIMIFGCWGVPAMGIRGAALATVLSQSVSVAGLFYLLYRKYHLLGAVQGWAQGHFLATARQILGFGIPAILSMILMPVSAAVITRLLGSFGNEVVAAAGAAARIEMFAFVVPMALGISLTPFISQNFGANRLDRIREAMTVSTRFALIYGAGIAVLFFVGARWLAGLFSTDPQVVDTLVDYVRIISFGYGMMEVHRYCGFALTGLHKPVQTTLLNVIRVLVLLIPLSWLGARWYGVQGVFAGRLLTDLTVGSIGLAWVRWTLRAPVAVGNLDSVLNKTS